jgi:hypothetical protein
MATWTGSQARYRFRLVNADAAGANAAFDGADPAQDTPATIEVDTVFRVRITIQETAGGGANKTFGLRFSHEGSAYAVVTDSTPVQVVGVSGYADDAATSSILGGTGGFLAGYADDLDALLPTAGNQSWAGNEWSEYEIALLIDSAQVADADTIELRLYESGGAELGTYSVTPTITVEEGAAAVTVLAQPVDVAAEAQAAVPLAAAVVAAQPVGVAATAQAASPVVSSGPADFAEDWSAYPDSSFGNSTALDGQRQWRQGANRDPDGTRAGWRIQSGVAVAGLGNGSDVNASITAIDYRAPAIARCLDDVGSDDIYVRGTLGTAQWPDHFGLLGRMSSADSATCYYAQVRPSNGDIRIFTIIAGAFGSLVGTASYTTTPGDVIELRCFGTTISVRVNDTEVISETNSAVTAGHFGGLYAHNAINDSVRFTDFQTGPLDGSGDPVEDPAADPIPAIQFAWAGTAGKIIASTRNVGLVRVVVADNAGLTTPVFTSSYVAPDSLGLVEFDPTGLSADTQYFYGLQVDDVTVGQVRSFRTAPASGSFTFALSGDAGDINSGGSYVRSEQTVNSPAYDRIVDRDPAFFLFSGDRHYRDYNIADVAPHLRALRDVYDNPRAASVFDAMGVAQIWDDHDFTGDAADSTATGRDAAVETFRRAVPVESYLVDTGITDPVGYTFTWGRARFIVLDHRSEKLSGSTMLGSAQMTALLDLLENATEPLIFLYVGVPWIASSGSDNWAMSGSGRATIAEQIEDFAKGRVIILHADSHMLAADDGTNSQYDTGTTDPGPPVFCSAPVDSLTSSKGGPYSEGFVPDPVGSRQEQYATIEVADTGGSSIVVTWRGWSVDDATETEVISLEVTIGEAAVSIQAAPAVVSALAQAADVQGAGVAVQGQPVEIQASPQAASPSAGGGGITFARAQASIFSADNIDPGVASLGSAVTEGNLLVVHATERSGQSAANLNIADSGSDTGWVKRVAETTEQGDVNARRTHLVFVKVATAADAAASPFTISVDDGTSNGKRVLIEEFEAGAEVTWAFEDAAAANTGTGSTSPLNSGDTASTSGEQLLIGSAIWRTEIGAPSGVAFTSLGDVITPITGNNGRHIAAAFAQTSASGVKSTEVSWAGPGHEANVALLVFSATETGAGVTVQAQPVTVAADAQAATLDLGALAVAAAPATVQAQAQAAVPAGSGVVVQAAPVVISAAAQSGSLDLSALVVTASPVAVQAQAQAASVGGGVFVAAQPATVAAGGQAAALDLGALSVQGDPVTVAAGPQAAALDLGTLALQAQPVDIAAAAQAANVNSGSVLISAQPATVAAAAQAADLLTAVVVQASPVLVGANPQAATILGGAVTVSAQPVLLAAAAQEADPVRAATLIQAQPAFVQAAAQVALVEAVVVVQAQPVVVTVEPQPSELAVVVVIEAEPISLAVVVSAAVVLSGPQPVGRALQPMADLRALQPVGNLRALQPLG